MFAVKFMNINQRYQRFMKFQLKNKKLSMAAVFFLTCDCRCSLHHLLLVSAGDQSGRVGDKIHEVFEILTFSSLVLFPLSSLPRTATWRGEAKRGCSFSVEPGCKLLQLFLPNQLLSQACCFASTSLAASA